MKSVGGNVKRFDRGEMAKVIDLYTQGVTPKMIASRFGVNVSLITKSIRQHYGVARGERLRPRHE